MFYFAAITLLWSVAAEHPNLTNINNGQTIAARHNVKAKYVTSGNKVSAVIAKREIGSGKLNQVESSTVSSLKKKSYKVPTITSTFCLPVKVTEHLIYRASPGCNSLYRGIKGLKYPVHGSIYREYYLSTGNSWNSR
jgi:hypothetical protein